VSRVDCRQLGNIRQAGGNWGCIIDSVLPPTYNAGERIPAASMAKHIFVTGGVVSSVGKGITVASIGTLLKARGINVDYAFKEIPPE